MCAVLLYVVFRRILIKYSGVLKIRREGSVVQNRGVPSFYQEESLPYYSPLLGIFVRVFMTVSLREGPGTRTASDEPFPFRPPYFARV